MQSLLVDSHCHLNLLSPRGDTDQLDAGEVDAAIRSAVEAGVGHMLCVSIDLDSYSEIQAIVGRHQNVFASVGVHPNEHPAHEPEAQQLVSLSADPGVVAIGETGLDYFRNHGDTEWQRERFRCHIAAAKSARLPLVVHSRDAREDTVRLLAEEGASEVGGVMHCFVEDWHTAKRAMDLNFYISFSGIVTFKNAADLKEVAKRIPLDRLMVETDSPYLAPVPYRGKVNQPAYVRYVAEHLAELRETTFETIAHATTANFFALFTRATPAR